TRAPSTANSRAISWPMPRPEPVMTVTLLARRISILPFAAVTRHAERRLPEGAAIAAREDQIQGLAVRAHPLRREAARLARVDVPGRRVGHGRPRPPGLRGVEDTEPGPDLPVRARLAEQVALQPGVVTDRHPVALPRVGERGAPRRHVRRPDGPP